VVNETANAAKPKGNFDNAADPVAIDAKKEEAKQEVNMVLEDLKLILLTPHGKRYIRELIRRGGLFDCTYTGNQRGTFLEGARNLALQLREDVREADKIAYAKIISTVEEEYDA